MIEALIVIVIICLLGGLFTVNDVGWTEAAREASRLARAASKAVYSTLPQALQRMTPEQKEQWKRSQAWGALRSAQGSTRRAREASEKFQAVGERVASRWRSAREAREAAAEFNKPINKSLPYKVATYNPDTDSYKIITSFPTFREANSYPTGTHVIQTHEPSAAAATSNAAQRAGVGFLLAGPLGAAVGAATSESKGGWVELNEPVVTEKRKMIKMDAR